MTLQVIEGESPTNIDFIEFNRCVTRLPNWMFQLIILSLLFAYAFNSTEYFIN